MRQIPTTRLLIYSFALGITLMLALGGCSPTDPTADAAPKSGTEISVGMTRAQFLDLPFEFQVDGDLVYWTDGTEGLGRRENADGVRYYSTALSGADWATIEGIPVGVTGSNRLTGDYQARPDGTVRIDLDDGAYLIIDWVGDLVEILVVS